MAMRLGVGLVSDVVLVVVLLVLAYTAISDTASDVGNAAGNITSGDSTATYPLTSFFKKKGIILLAFMAGIALVFIKAFLPSRK